MERLILIFEIIGTISFALTGAMTGLKKQMDIFGVCVLGVTTAVGGGIIRDLILGLTPPSAFRDPTSVLIAIAVSIIVFFPAVRRIFYRNKWLYEHVLLLADSAGLGIFTVCGARVAMEAGDGGVLPPPRGAPCRPAGMRHGTGREAGRGMDANTMAASRNIPGLCPEIATAERESAEFYYLCGAGPLCRCRPQAGRGKSGQRRAPRRLTA